jgi:two-component system response regulator FixJ
MAPRALQFVGDASNVLRRICRDGGSKRMAQEQHREHALTAIPGAELLTPREREVLARVVAGASNKEAGRALGISPRTVEVHRARIMGKLGAKNTADLVRIVLEQPAKH